MAARSERNAMVAKGTSSKPATATKGIATPSAAKMRGRSAMIWQGSM